MKKKREVDEKGNVNFHPFSVTQLTFWEKKDDIIS